MFIRVKTFPNVEKKTVQIVESVRKGNKVKQRIVRHVGSAATEDEIKALKDLAEHIKSKLEEEITPSLFDSETLTKLTIKGRDNSDKGTEINVDLKKLRHQQDIILGIHDIYGQIYNELGFNRLFSKRHNRSSNNIFQMVMARIANPDSKRASVEELSKNFGSELSLDSVYRSMNLIDENIIERINMLAYENARSLLNNEITAIFYDCTTLYFESFKEDELKSNGYSKDMKFNQAQVMLALITTTEGLPIGYNLFSGSTFEGNTMSEAINKLKNQYKLKRIIFTADSGLLSNENKLLLENSDIEYILGARLKSTSKAIQHEILSKEDYEQVANNDHYQKKKIISLKGEEKLIITYSESRAKKDRHDRKKAIDSLEKRLKKSKNPASLINNYGFKKFIEIKGDSQISINKEKIEASEQWDGLHGLITNVKSLSHDEILSHYKSLWQIEECFRISKHDLRIRPIYHWAPEKIKAHIAICFMALVCVKHLTHRIKLQYKPMSPEAIRNQLIAVKISISKDIETNKKYAIPSRITQEIKKIYNYMKIKISDIPFEIFDK